MFLCARWERFFLGGKRSLYKRHMAADIVRVFRVIKSAGLTLVIFFKPVALARACVKIHSIYNAS